MTTVVPATTRPHETRTCTRPSCARSRPDQPHEEDETPIVYVTPFPNEKPIPLDVQVGVVDAVADNATVRFVDEEDQAIDKGAEGEPVVDDGVLVRIGTVPEEGTTVTVPAELYHSDNDIVAHRVPGHRRHGQLDSDREIHRIRLVLFRGIH